MDRVEKELNRLSEFGYSDKGINRIAYTRVEQEALQYLAGLCKKENLSVKIDSCGNLIARREGIYRHLPVVAFGSHIDTVYNGGKYDGAVGVISGIEVIRRLNEKNIQTDHPIELIIFACEESARFGLSTVGSKAMSGKLKKEDVIKLTDREGVSFQDALSVCALDCNQIHRAKRKKDELKAFFEIHIEQGPVLEANKKTIGIVKAIAAPTRYRVVIKGEDAHSGTTPMHIRRDAFMAAAELALSLEEAARSEQTNETVATIGVCHVSPGAMNVIPGEVELAVDIRGSSKSSKKRVVEKMKRTLLDIERNRNVEMKLIQLCDEKPVDLDATVIASLAETCRKKGHPYMLMHSGAGHDAMNMAALCPTGMIFIPSKNGLSHNAEEYTKHEDILVGIDLLEAEVIKWASASFGLKTSRRERSL